MPAGSRIRSNNVYGLISDNPLTIGATTMNSTGLTALPAVSSAHVVLVLDPKRVFGDPEIVVVTSHVALSTVATIVRAQYSTTARSHAMNTAWAHVAIDEDYVEIVTSITRPSNPYEGQFIFETDTDKLVGFGGVDWAPRDAGGQLGFGAQTATQSGITAATDLTGATTTVTVGTGRRVKISAYTETTRTVADGTTRIRILEGATTLQVIDEQPNVVSDLLSTTGMVILSPSAGAHTYKLSLERLTGTGTVGSTVGADLIAFILVEDIGAV